jgi:hypothetical protein
MNKISSTCLVLMIIVLLPACQSGVGELIPTSLRQEETVTETTGPPTATLVPSDTPLPSPTFTPSVTPIIVMDPAPVIVEFTAEDGQALSGLFYPASENPAPLLVLMQWARGDQSDWTEIAFWLQGRGLLEKKPDYNRSWRSSNLFPDRKIDQPLGIFTFNLRECEGGCQAYLPTEWLLDIEAAMSTAIYLHGVDPDQIITGGASIGADGALYGCAWLNAGEEGKCRGTFSLSPSSLLTIPYDTTAQGLIEQDPSMQIYCLLALRDDASVETCLDKPGLTVVDYGYSEFHGMELFQTERIPNPWLKLEEFIGTALVGVDHE